MSFKKMVRVMLFVFLLIFSSSAFADDKMDLKKKLRIFLFYIG